MAAKIGDKLLLSETTLTVLSNAQPSTRDGNWRIRARVEDGEFKGQELWLIGDTDDGPWSTAGVGFV